jgi:hypothetical protein
MGEEPVSGERTRAYRAVGDLGTWSGLIARDLSELQELKSRGEREYFDFSLEISGQFAPVGPIAIRLRALETLRHKFTLTLLVDGREVEKQNKTLLEPVQFYMKGQRAVSEIIVYEIADNRANGYLSVAKAAGETEDPVAPGQSSAQPR